MQSWQKAVWLVFGFVFGASVALAYRSQPQIALANNDRHDDYIMCTGSVMIDAKNFVDGVWVLDYRAGKLLGTVVDRNLGKVYRWAEVDLIQEFGIAPKQNVHFLMTTGTSQGGQTALYVAETTTGRFGVYSMGAPLNPQQGIIIRRHHATRFRPGPAPQ